MSKFSEEIEIETYVFTYKFPDRFTRESLKLKKAIIECNRRDVLRTNLIQSYINEDWNNFAKKYAQVDFGIYLSFVVLVMVQFWQTSMDKASQAESSQYTIILVPVLSISLLIVNVLKEIV